MGIAAIVGRPNVGKSSLFNRMLGRREAIVDDFPGVTRDRLYAPLTHGEKTFYIVDTGGINGESGEASAEIRGKTAQQVSLAIEESECVVFVIDGADGPTAGDIEIAEMLRRGGRDVIVAVNKVDSPARLDAVYDAASLGFETIIPVSAVHGSGVGELMDEIASRVTNDEADEEGDIIPTAIVGRPNVGKSSLLNALAGEERSLVSDIPGTTRDVVDTIVEAGGATFRFLDTAGLRRKSRVKEDIEYYSNVRAYRAIDRCRTAIVVLDASELVTEQDKRLIGAVLERGKALVIVVNKWDLTDGGERSGDKMRKLLSDELPFAAHVPAVFTSALSGRGIKKLTDLIRSVDENRRSRISTSELNRLAREILAFERMPGDGRGRSLKVRYCTQADGPPPAFIFFVNDASLVSRPFVRRLENIIRGMAEFRGVPIKIFFRDKDASEKGR